MSHNSPDPHWYETFFTGVPLDVWQKAISPEVTRAEVDFLERELRLEAGQSVLDLPCGAGRHSIGLARRGYEVTGIDISAENIERANAAAAGASCRFQAGDMRDVPTNLQVDAAICMGNSYGYLQDDETRSFVAGLARALKPGGRLVIDSGTHAESLLPKFDSYKRSWYLGDDIYLLLDQRYNAQSSRLETAYTHITGGVVDVRHGSQRVYTIAETKGLLLSAGLRTIATYSDLNGAAFEFNNSRLLLVAERA